MSTNQEQAEFLRLGLITGLLGSRAVIRWADSVISSSTQPDYCIIQIATAPLGDIGEMIRLLRRVSGAGDLLNAARAFLGLVRDQYSNGELSLEHTLKILSLVSQASELNHEFSLQISNVEDELKDAQRGIVPLDFPQEGIRELLNRWATTWDQLPIGV